MKIFITGTPGTGKSTLSVALKKSIHLLDIFEIKELLIKFDLLEDYEPERDTTLFDGEQASKKIQNFLATKDNYILVGPPLYFDTLQFDVVVVLTCSKKLILQDRLKSRGYKNSKIEENLEAELLGEILGESMDVFANSVTFIVLDSCSFTVEELIEKIKEKISD